MLIADVSGKGTSAALYMAELKGLMLSLSRIHTSPRALLIEANGIIKDHLDSRSFITMTYAVVDRAAGTLTCARAGHTPFMRIAGGGARRVDVLAPDGMVLGLNLDRGERFERYLEELTLPIAAGDLFFFFTDGVSEAMDAGGDCFGESRLSTFLAENAGQAARSDPRSPGRRGRRVRAGTTAARRYYDGDSEDRGDLEESGESESRGVGKSRESESSRIQSPETMPSWYE